MLSNSLTGGIKMNRMEAYNVIVKILKRTNKRFRISNVWLSLLYWSGRYQSALRFITISKPNEFVSMCWMGTIYYLSHELNLARELFEKAKSLDRTSREITFLLAETYFSMSEIEKAEVLYRSLIPDPDFVFHGLYRTGCCLIELKRFDEAISFFNRAISHASGEDLVKTLNKKGLCLLNQQLLEEATELFEKCLKLSPDNFSAKQNLALAATKTKDHEKAVSLYKEILLKSPYDIIAINNLALNTAALGNYSGAMELCNQGLSIDPLNPDLLANKGYCLYKLNDYKNALNCIIEAEKILKEDPILKNNKALCLCALGDYKTAIQIFDELLNQQVSDDILFNKAFCLLKVGQYREALDTLDKIEQKDDKKSDIYTIQSACYEKLGENDKAVAILNKLLIA
jgi:tetratricopeptide (TPR) repeat protein